ncbi:hypothetical protein B0T16DRAFT_391579 [Cercophora newfieldiana]|uniref:Uncharacterized protein n=1 Tax=Cercophora newfieldiana TaxID=92897 RepID=A0AA39XZ40_9PEZI|nr:hypothetical protein B0T16DRAFT_391579 [Cercophora newfieldiana]
MYEPLLVRYREPAVRGLYRDVHKILRMFLRKIDCYKPLLGRNRKRWSVRSALAKLRWPVHSEALRQLSRDLQDKIQLINSFYLIQTIQLPQSNPFLHQPRPSRFILEDASGRVRSMPFSDVGTWDVSTFHGLTLLQDLQQCLVRLYPELAVIESKSYIFNNTTTRQDILPSSPLIQPLREVVADDERLVMSVILPLGGYLTKRSLKCSRRSEDQLRKTMRGVDRAKAILSQPPDAPFDAAAWAIGAYHQRHLYSDFAQQQPYPFEPTALRVRCLLWTLVEMRQLEGKLITHLVHTIQHSGLWVPRRFQQPTTPLPYKLFTIPHIMLLPVWRCTFDLAADVGQAIRNHLFPEGPPVHLAALFSVLVGSESVSYDRVLDGNCSSCRFGLLRLDPTSKSALNLKEDVWEQWTGRYQNALEEFVVLATD